MKELRIGVSGANGQLGAATVAELVRRGGHEITGISRSPEKIPAPAVGRLGDYDRPETLAAAYAGLDRLLLIPTAEMGPGRRAGQSLAAIDAAVAAGVGHIVLMSSAGTRAAQEPDIYASYYAAEQRLMRTAPRWTILRMNYYAEALVQEAQMSLAAGVLTGLGENRVAFVSREDVAAAAAGLLASGDHAGAIYHATGPPWWPRRRDGRSRFSCSPNRCSARGWSRRGCRLPSSGRSCRSRRSSCRAASTSSRATSNASPGGSRARCGTCLQGRSRAAEASPAGFG
jgi:uncharacterized protein YbjT (DUF2867 family)